MQIIQSLRDPVHKWKSNVQQLDEEPNPSKILGLMWEKRDDTLEIQVKMSENSPVTNRSILSQLCAIYDPLRVISPTIVEGKRIYREACEEKAGWSSEVSCVTRRDWLKCSSHLRNVKVPRSIVRDISKIKGVHLHVFADASNIACPAATIAVVEHSTGFVKRLITSKSRISRGNTTIARLELVSGQMAANMVKNLVVALKRWPIASVNVWMDSTVTLYWICSPSKSWKVFVSNRVRKIAQITKETGIVWRHCSTNKNLADLRSRGASLKKMQKGKWFEGPDWLMNEDEWPVQPRLERTTSVSEEHKPEKEKVLYAGKREPNEWDAILTRSTLWRTFRVTVFVRNSLIKRRNTRKRCGPLTSEDINTASTQWIRRAQTWVEPTLESPGLKLATEEDTGILKCHGRIPGYQPTYIEGGKFANKLIRHVHEDISTLASRTP